MSYDEDEAKYEAILEFIGHFPTLSGPPPSDMDSLNDGVALFEVLSEMWVSNIEVYFYCILTAI